MLDVLGTGKAKLMKKKSRKRLNQEDGEMNKHEAVGIFILSYRKKVVYCLVLMYNKIVYSMLLTHNVVCCFLLLVDISQTNF